MKDTKIEWIQIDGVECIKFTFKDVFTHKEAVIASEEWKKSFSEKANQKVPVIFDAIEMKDYEALSRSVWQKTMTELKNQIDGIWLVTDSKIIAAGAKIMGVFTSFTIKTVSTADKINLQNASEAILV